MRPADADRSSLHAVRAPWPRQPPPQHLVPTIPHHRTVAGVVAERARTRSREHRAARPYKPVGDVFINIRQRVPLDVGRRSALRWCRHESLSAPTHLSRRSFRCAAALSQRARRPSSLCRSRVPVCGVGGGRQAAWLSGGAGPPGSSVSSIAGVTPGSASPILPSSVCSVDPVVLGPCGSASSGGRNSSSGR